MSPCHREVRDKVSTLAEQDRSWGPPFTSDALGERSESKGRPFLTRNVQTFFGPARV